MIRIATERAHTQGLDNVEFHVVDADRMAPPANGFDATVCRWALMFFADPSAASSHPPRTQAGWLAASTVGQPDRNPLVSTVVGAICGPHALPPPPAAPAVGEQLDVARPLQGGECLDRGG
jgi:hypothetical protein